MQWAGVGMWMVLGLSACSPTKTEIGNLNVIPQPQEVSQDIQAHPFVINPQTGIVYPEGNEKLQRTAEFLASYIEEATGITVRTTTEAARKNSIILAVDGSITNKEGYQLEVTSENIHLNGGSESGVFYGIQTLYKALPLTKNKQVSAAIPVGTVNDYPRFGYRGFMVDVGRHYFPVSYLKQIIDMLALHNINYFHWHLTEDQGWRIEIKKYPKLTEIGSMRPRTLIDRETQTYDETPHSGFYTQCRHLSGCNPDGSNPLTEINTHYCKKSAHREKDRNSERTVRQWQYRRCRSFRPAWPVQVFLCFYQKPGSDSPDNTGGLPWR